VAQIDYDSPRAAPLEGRASLGQQLSVGGLRRLFNPDGYLRSRVFPPSVVYKAKSLVLKRLFLEAKGLIE
jgi:hypothetical protein